MLRNHPARASSRWNILVDCSASMHFGRRWDFACDIASAIAAILLHQSHRVGLILFDSEMRTSVPARSGVLHLHQINAALDQAMAKPDGQVGSVLSALRHLPRPSGIVVLSDLLWGSSMETALRACQKCGGDAHVLRLAAIEDTETFARARAVKDAESGERQVLADSMQVRNGLARRNLEALDDRAAKASRKAGAVYSSVAVDAGWKSAIIAHLARAAKAHA